jgi:cytoskeletal protein RodZ
LPLLIAVGVGLVIFVLRRAFFGRRLTIEQSVDRHRRALSAVHDAATRAREGEGTRAEGGVSARPMSKTARTRSRRLMAPRSRWQLAVALMAVATVATVGIVIAQNGDTSTERSSPTTTTRPPATHPTTTTRPAPTTTVALVTPTDGSGTAFTIAKPTYTLVVQTTTGDCWIDARDPAGTSLFSGTILSGQSQSITGSTFTLQLGNPAAVSLSVEGKAVPFSLAGGSAIRLQFVGRPAAT